MDFAQAKKALGIKSFRVKFCTECGTKPCTGGEYYKTALKLTAKRAVKEIKGSCATSKILGKLRGTGILTDSYENGTMLRMLWGDPWELKGKVVWYETKKMPKGDLVITRAILECKNGYALLDGARVPKNTKAIKGGL